MSNPLEKIIGKLLTKKKLTLSIAESCTGGLICHKITNVAGSSSYFERGIISYSNRSKEELLKVTHATLIRYGAVSRQIAKAMANGVKNSSGTDIGLSITGIAGPTGGTKTKPIGLVYIGLSHGKCNMVNKLIFKGSREIIKERASQASLDFLRRYLKKI